MPSVKRILVVDDDRSICDLVADVLSDDGWSVTTASNGAEALVKMRATEHDLVMLDLMMPVLDGWGVLAVRQTDADLRAVPVLAMSAGGERCLDRARALGADRCMPKPFELSALVAILESLRLPVDELDRADRGLRLVLGDK